MDPLVGPLGDPATAALVLGVPTAAVAALRALWSP